MSKSTFHVIRLDGTLDVTTTSALRTQIQAIAPEVDGVLLNLDQVEFIDSSGLGGLAIIMKGLQKSQKRFCVCSAGEQARMLFELTGMENVFEIYPDEATFWQTDAEAANASGATRS